MSSVEKTAAYKATKFDYYGLTIYEEVDGPIEYAVGTDSEATDAAIRYCRDSLWAFRAEFLAQFVNAERAAPIIALACEMCEGGNEIVALLLGDRIGEMIDAAIRCDGRGHFLSSYDGEELDTSGIEGLPDGLVAYRVN